MNYRRQNIDRHAVTNIFICHHYRLYDNLTLTRSSGCLTTLSERNLVGMKPITPLSRRVLTPIACPGQEPLSK